MDHRYGRLRWRLNNPLALYDVESETPTTKETCTLSVQVSFVFCHSTNSYTDRAVTGTINRRLKTNQTLQRPLPFDVALFHHSVRSLRS